MALVAPYRDNVAATANSGSRVGKPRVGADAARAQHALRPGVPLDVFENMRITAITQKHAADDATWFRSGTALQLAGPGAAAVMGQPGLIGELRVGARADVILVDVSGFHCQPLHDLAATDRSHGRTIQGYTT